MNILKKTGICASLAILLTTTIYGQALPSPWAEESIDFAIEAGIVEQSDVRAQEPATRGELAMMITNLYETSTMASMEAFSDVTIDSIYYEAMSEAVALGIYTGDNGLLEPEKAVTRQEAFVVLARALGVEQGNRSVLNNYTDGWHVENWAAPTIAGMIESGYIVGNEQVLESRNTITREELAILIHRLAGSVCMDAVPAEEGNVFLTEKTISNQTIHGNLILSASFHDTVTLRNVEIEGNLIVPQGTVKFAGTTSCKTVICLNESATVEGFDNVYYMGQADEMPQQEQAPLILSFTKSVNEATPTSPMVSTETRFFNVPVEWETNPQSIILEWYVDGVLCDKIFDLPIKPDTVVSFEGIAQYPDGNYKKQGTVTMRMIYGDTVASNTQVYDRNPQLLPTNVETLNVIATVDLDTKLYSNDQLGGYIGTVEAGTQGIYNDYVGRYSAKLTLPDGRVGWVPWYNLTISRENYVQSGDYTLKEKEHYVNKMGYSSTTDMMVWLNLLHTKVHVFQGEEGAWKLTQTFDCSVGKNTTPTNPGVFKYYTRTGYWDFDGYKVYNPMSFNGGHAFHTRTYINDSKTALLDPTINGCVSQGCVRMYDEDVNWLWNNMPMGTTVVVY